MRPKIKLIWNEWNIAHIAKHGVGVKEIEEAVRDRKAIMKKVRKRCALIGSAWGRVLFIVLEKRKDGYFVVTARDATSAEKRLYRRR